MTIKQRFILSYLSSFAISIVAMLAIVAMVFAATLGEIPSPANFYKMLTVQRGLTKVESDAFLKLSRVVQRSPELITVPFNEELTTIIDDIEANNLKVVIRKNNTFPYYTNGLVLASLEVHAPEYEIHNFEPIGTLDNNGKLYRYVKNDFHYLDGSVGSIVVLNRETTLFEVFSKWGIGIIIAILAAAIALASTINRKLKKSTIDPIETLEFAMQQVSDENDLNQLLEEFPQDNISKDIAQLQVRFKEMWQQLQSLEKLRDADEANRIALIANISHDLRTPIASIIGYIEGLLEGVAATPEKQHHYLKTVHQKANDLNNLIETLFLYSKLEHQELNFDTKPINLIELLESIVYDYDESKPKPILIYEGESLMIDADAFHLRRAFVNIIENSIKFTDPEKTEAIIEIQITKTDESLVVTLSDNGKGIDENDLPFIFDRFYRGEKSRFATVPGSGLGLGIVKQIIDRHKGFISITSTFTIGTEVRITLPRVRKHL